jgi:hypothetical protein
VDRRRRSSFGDDQVDRLRAGELDVRPGRVEVGIRRHDLAGPRDHAEEDLLGGPALVRGNDVAKGKEAGHRLEEAEPRGRAGVGLVATLDAGPLLGAHRARARIGEEVDQDVGSVEVEEVVARLAQVSLALVHRGHPDRLDALDPERLDDRVPALHQPMVPARDALGCA